MAPRGKIPAALEGTTVKLLAQVAVLLVAAEHLWFLVLEMFLFTKPVGLKTFRLTEASAKQAAPAMANQGLYNGFLAAGLLWSLFAAEPLGFQLKLFFLGCVVVAGVFGAATVGRVILFFQALPAAVAVALLLLAQPS
jgi:putative membrane protein